MGKFLKKNWFVMLVVAIFIVISTYYIYDTNKGKLKGKKVNGEDVVYSIGDNDTTASEFYDTLFKTNGSSAELALFRRTVADASISTTNEIKDSAAKQAESIISNYRTSYGNNYETKLQSDLAATGYTDLEEYLIQQQKVNQLTAEYAQKHFDELKIRQISYILIKFTDTTNPSAEPTEDEAARMKAVDDELAAGDSFADVASRHSEDTSTSVNGGLLGVIDKNTSTLDATFLETSLALNEGEVSQWVRSSSFGYFKIIANATTQSKLEELSGDDNPYLTLVQNYDTSLADKALWDKAQELGVDFKGNTELENSIKKSLGVSTDESEGTK
ncbi:MAG: peptidylprolyl isomerase [Erysipelotrichaceae bacterium]|nr:peptidylprolyl isomerase [Erysipelotrichaceae bacterium]MDY6034077.1 peptidylprolyl isomerase [Bulleidia sp.]